MFRFAQHDNYGRLFLFLIRKTLRPGRLRGSHQRGEPRNRPGRNQKSIPDQCKGSIVILRRSEDRRRICIKVYIDRFLTALRLSFSSLLGIVRKRSLHSLRSSIRSAQNDKGLEIRGAACGARPATAGCLRAFAGQGCGPHGSKEPHDATTFVQKPLFSTFRRIPFSDCYTTPAAGYRYRDTGVLTGVGTHGEWWSSSPWSADHHHASHLAGVSGLVCPVDTNGTRAFGFSVRCVQASAGCRSGIGPRCRTAPTFRGRSRQQPTKEGEKRLYGRRRFRKSSFWKS